MTLADLERFRKICGMLASEHAGERASAALLASNFLRERSLTWSSVSLPVEQPDVLAQRRESMGAGLWASSEQIRAATREREKAARENDRAARKAAWKERSYGADADGFEPGRK